MESLPFFSSHSLFSTIIVLYILILLYFPAFLLRFIFSPAIFCTLILLLHLLRLGASQNSRLGEDKFDSIQMSPRGIEESMDRDRKWNSDKRTELRVCSGYEFDLNRNPNPDAFIEWDVRAPLDVIYEEYEGEEADENDAVSDARRESEMNVIRRYASLSLFYPESDSDSSSEGYSRGDGDCESPETTCFQWEEENDVEGLIEIALENDEKRGDEVDEENLIEIDLSPAR